MSDVAMSNIVNNNTNNKEVKVSKIDKILDASVSIRGITTGTKDAGVDTVHVASNIIDSHRKGWKAYKGAFSANYSMNKAIYQLMKEQEKAQQ